MTEMTETQASRFLNNQINLINWPYVSVLIAREMTFLRGARIERSQGGESEVKNRQHIQNLLAAEFFPDENPPRLVVAETEDELHNDLRKKFPSQAPRLSGEILEITSQGLKFFVLDAVTMDSIGNKDLPTKAQLAEIVEQLLAMDIVPLDAELNLVLLKN